MSRPLLPRAAAAAVALLAVLLGARTLAQQAEPAPTGAKAADSAAGGGEEITVNADSLSYDSNADTLTASGNVVIRRGDAELRAEKVILNRSTSEAEVDGEAIFSNPQAQIRAKSMELNMDSETGLLTGAHIHSKTLGYTLTGERIEKRIGRSVRIENGRFTTCNCPCGPQPWTIAAGVLDVKLDGYSTLEDGRFEVFDRPVFWLPRAAFPAYQERQSGLLLPRAGFSNRRGFQLLEPYYWAIDKSQDVTLSGDIETAARLGLLGEYRYAFSRDTDGRFQFGYFNEAIRSKSPAVSVPIGIDPTAPENRWGMIGDHTQKFGSSAAYGDMLLVGDNLFLREMNTFTPSEEQEIDLRTLPFTTSRVGALHAWERALVRIEGVYYQDLVGPSVQQPDGTFEQDTSLVIQKAPEVELSAQKQLGYGIMGGFTGSVTDFQRGTGLTGFRGDLRPAVQLRFPLGRSFHGLFNAAFRETAYGLTNNTMFGGFTGTNPAAGEIILPSGSTREIFELQGEFGTSVSRVFDFPYLGLAKLKHTIEPMVQYRYVPPVDQSELPVWDGVDRVTKRSMFTYGFATRILARSAAAGEDDGGEVFELVRLAVLESYDFLRDIQPVTLVDPITGLPVSPSAGDHLSDIDFDLRVNPGPVTSIRTWATYSPVGNEFSSATVGIYLREPARALDPAMQPRLLNRASLKVEYRFINDNVVQLLLPSATLPIADRISGVYTMRYDINANAFLGNYFGLQLLSSCDCWALTVGFIQTHNPNEVQVQAQFVLAGFGEAMKGGAERY